MGSSASKNKKEDPQKGADPPSAQKKAAGKGKDEGAGGQYEPFLDFPDPVLLLQAQEEYTKAKVRVEKDEEGVPLPFPPPTSREEALATADLAKIDSHATDPDSLCHAEGTYTELMKFLVEPARNDIEKVRAFFVWIGTQTPQKVFGYLGDRMPDGGTPLRAMATIMAKKMSGLYNEVLQKLCQAAGIPCILQRCSAKGSSYRVGEPVRHHGNGICLVFVDGAWRMIDQHWGSESVSATPDDQWQLVQDRGATKSPRAPVQKVFYNIDEFYFLTDPYVMVYSLRSLEPKNQLLPRPVTSEEYNEVAYLRPGFFVLGMSRLSHPKCKVVCDNGTVQFEFGQGKKAATFYYNLYKSAKDKKNDRFKGATPKEFSWMHETKDALRLKIEFPWIGKYKLDIECEITTKTRRSRYRICEYLVVVTQPMFGVEPRPGLPEGCDLLGVTAPIRDLGILPIQNEDGIVHAERGGAEVKFSCQDPSKVRIRANLLSVQNADAGRPRTKTGEADILRYFKNIDGTIAILAKLSQEGNRVLTMNVIKENEKHQQMNYLIESDQGCTDLISNYPDALDQDGLIGDLADDNENRLIAVSHPCPHLEGPANGNTCFELKQTTDTELNLQAELKLNNTLLQNEFLFHEQEGQSHFFYTRFPRVGIYSLNISSCKNGKPRPVYQYLINVTKPNTQALSFAQVTDLWSDGFKLIEPKDGELSESPEVEFKLVVPGATRVYLENAIPPVRHELSNESDDTWSGKFPIRGGMDTLTMRAQIEDQEPCDMITYRIMDKNKERKRNSDTKKAEKEAENRRKELEEQQARLDKEKKQKQEAKEKEIKESEEDFKANKQAYEQREKQLEELAAKQEAEPEEEPDYSVIKLDEEMEDKNLEKKLKDAKKDADEGWKALYGEKSRKLLLERLKEAMARRDIEKMEKGVADCRRASINDSIVNRAKQLIRVEHAKADLREAMDNKDEQEIVEKIQYIEDDNLLSHLQHEVAEARALLDLLARSKRNRGRVLDMNKQTMSELRRYNVPPENVHHVLQAALLLLGEDEKATEEWRSVQKLCNPFNGKNGLNHRILNHDPDEMDPEIAARSREMLQDVDLAELKKKSAGASVFYVWAMGVLDDAKLEENVSPANTQRQKEILGRLTPPPPEKSYQKYYNRHKNKQQEDNKTKVDKEE